MDKKLLELLKTKFSGVDDSILSRIAEKKADGVTDEGQLQPIVDGISFADVLNSYGDYRANGATLSAVQNYEKKHGIKDGKPVGKPIEEPKPKEDEPDIASIVAKAVSEAVKPFSEKITSFENEKQAALRKSDILSKAKEYGIPESYAKRCAIKDDEDLDVYFKDLKQDFANDGFSGVEPPESSEQKVEKENESIANMISEETKKLNENK